MEIGNSIEVHGNTTTDDEDIKPYILDHKIHDKMSNIKNITFVVWIFLILSLQNFRIKKYKKSNNLYINIL